jgi:hypothetical protein
MLSLCRILLYSSLFKVYAVVFTCSVVYYGVRACLPLQYTAPVALIGHFGRQNEFEFRIARQKCTADCLHCICVHFELHSSAIYPIAKHRCTRYALQPTDTCQNTTRNVIHSANAQTTGAAERSKAADFSRVGTRQLLEFPPKHLWLFLTGDD